MTEQKKEQWIIASVVAAVILIVALIRPAVFTALVYTVLAVVGFAIALWAIVAVARWGGEMKTEMRRIADALEAAAERQRH